MFKIMQTKQYDDYFKIVFTYHEECFFAAGDYKNGQPQIVILDAIDIKDVKENMFESDYISYYSLINDVESHEVLQHINEILSTGIRLDSELVS